jgi:hypothetical protein
MLRSQLCPVLCTGLFLLAHPYASAQNAEPVEINDGLLTRLFQDYVDEFNPSPQTAAQPADAAPTRRPAPFPQAPLASPPWPWADWPFGGTPMLGGATPNSSGNNLMKALHGTSFGNFLNDNNIEIWGWINGGMNLSTSQGKKGNLPIGYDYDANLPMLNQAVINFQRVPNTVQTDYVDWGFDVTGLYGSDYRFVTMNGVFSNQLLKNDNQYGYDLTNFYFDVYIPWIGEGTDIRVGRYVTLPDIEADLALQNVFYSHSMYYVYDPFTQMGVVASTRLNKNWMVQLGLSAGNDNAPWTSSAKPTVTACLQYESDSSWDNVYLCANGTNDGLYAYNNVQFYVATWFHRLTQRLWLATEDYYEYERKVPIVATIPGANPALCATGTSCWAGAYALSLYIMYQLSDKDYVGLRSEGYDDVRGQRTGFATWYSESTLGYVHWLSNSIALRPEIRFDHSYAEPTYNNGKANSQFTAAADVLIKF